MCYKVSEHCRYMHTLTTGKLDYTKHRAEAGVWVPSFFVMRLRTVLCCAYVPFYSS